MKHLVSFALFFSAVLELTASEAPFRRQVLGTTSGWIYVSLDAAAQAEVEGVWLADSAGNPVAFIRESNLPDWSQTLSASNLVSGKDAAGLLVATFQIEALKIATTGYPDSLTLDLQITGQAPWAAEVTAEYRTADSDWLKSPTTQYLYNFSTAGKHTQVTIPFGASAARLHMKTINGRLDMVSDVSIKTRPRYRERTQRLVSVPLKVTQSDTLEIHTGPLPLRVSGLELSLQGAVAPVNVSVSSVSKNVQRNDHRSLEKRWAGSGVLWSLAGIQSAQTRIAFTSPVSASTFEIQTQAAAAINGVQLLVQEEGWLFVAEANQTYFLHFGSRPRSAPGNLASLPSPTDFNAIAQATLGEVTADPFGKVVQPEIWQRIQSWLPLIVITFIAVLALVTRRLLRPQTGA